MAVLDAKAWGSMHAEEALGECAKYLYGIRLLGPSLEVRVPVVESVSLVTCARALA